MFSKRLEQLNQVIERCEYTLSSRTTHESQVVNPSAALEMVHFLLYQVNKVEGIVYVIGNGGSSAIASHFCTDLLRTLEIPAATFSDASNLTCFANDFGYENVYKLPLLRNLRENDLLVAISSSGKSENILNAVQVASEKKVPVVTLSGFAHDNPLRNLGDLNFWIDSSDYGLVETAHFFLLHTVIDTAHLKNHHQEKSVSTVV